MAWRKAQPHCKGSASVEVVEMDVSGWGCILVMFDMKELSEGVKPSLEGSALLMWIYLV